MFSKILVPVDLAHVDQLEKALTVAADMAKHHGAGIVCLGITEQTPGAVAHTPAEYAAKLNDFAAGLADKHGVPAEALTLTSHDPTTEVKKLILKAVQDTGADLVVMASHAPSVTDYLWASHGGWVAEHGAISVFVVR